MVRMAFHPPIPPEHLPPPRPAKGAVNALVQAESLMQIAFILPSATLIGWGAGWWLGSKLHAPWIGIAGLVLGMVAGMVSVIRMALAAGNTPSKKDSR